MTPSELAARWPGLAAQGAITFQRPEPKIPRKDRDSHGVPLGKSKLYLRHGPHLRNLDQIPPHERHPGR